MASSLTCELLECNSLGTQPRNIKLCSKFCFCDFPPSFACLKRTQPRETGGHLHGSKVRSKAISFLQRRTLSRWGAYCLFNAAKRCYHNMTESNYEGNTLFLIVLEYGFRRRPRIAFL